MNDPHSQSAVGQWQLILERYERSLLDQRVILKQLGRKWSLLSYVRGGLFLAVLIAGFCGLRDFYGWAPFWWAWAAILAVGFFSIIAVHDHVERQLDRAKHLAEFFAEGAARCRRDWKVLPVPTLEAYPQFRPVALDLDVFGSASLAQLFGPVRTSIGLPKLAEWLMTPAMPSELIERQQAVKDLATNSAWRENFQLDCRVVSNSPTGTERFLAWVQSPNWLTRFPVLTWVAWISTSLMLAFGVGFWSALISPQVAGVAVLLLLAINFLLTVFLSGKVHEVFESVSSRKNEVQQYGALFEQVLDLNSTAARLVEIKNELTRGPHSAIEGMSSLAGIVWFGNLRRHGILFFAYLFLQFFVLWDLHVWRWLESWQRRYRDRVPQWFAALAQAEVLAAMGTLAYEHPEWCVPSVTEAGSGQILAVQIGHPLLPNQTRVCNDVSLGPAGTVLIVTGSNMSGKSTLLRSIGLNLILAQMGSVVCARKMSLPPIVLETSMRIDDSLSDGVSFFMAELKRLKEIVDRSAEVSAGGGQFVFLLDEILQGTNSAERRIAVEAVIRQLLRQGAFGSFTTHDLELARDDGLGQCSQNVYFTESFESTVAGDMMTFDYLMRPGIAPSTNALKLLRIVGLAGESRAS